MDGIFPLTFPPILDSVRAALPVGLSVYLVGGAVRDALLDRSTHDLDFVMERNAIKFARQVANTLNADFYPLDSERDTGRVIVTNASGKRWVLDFAAFRGSNLESDLLGRDFTLNAIAIDLNDNSIHDPLGGAQDLKDRLLRACSPTSFIDDPVRILRGVRLAANFGFHILPETSRLMKAAVGQLGVISPERIRDELFRLLDGIKPASCLRALDLLGALNIILPELTTLKGVSQPTPHVHNVWEHSLATVTHLESILGALTPESTPNTSSDLFSGLIAMRIGRYRQQISTAFFSRMTSDRSRKSLIMLAALYHDVAKPLTKKEDDSGQIRFWDHDRQSGDIVSDRGRALMLSNEEVAYLETVIRSHMRILFHTSRFIMESKLPSRRAVYRYFRDTGTTGVDVCILALADLYATYEQTLPQHTWVAALDVVRLMLENWFEKPSESISPKSLVNGDDLMRVLHLHPGKQIGVLLDTIREAQAMGEVSSRDQALELAKKNLIKE
jgi:poly(A) polymerase